MSAPEVKGWCPGALEPMEAADGLVVRVRPWTSQLTARQLAGLAQVARDFGPGEVELTSRANVQIRQVAPENLPAMQTALAALGLSDEDAAQERRRNFIFWPGETETFVKFEQIVLRGLPLQLPSKFGVSVDLSEGQYLAKTQSDIRIERGPEGLLIRADGAETGRSVASLLEAAIGVLELAEWFAGSGGIDETGRGRMKAHLAKGQALPELLSGAAKPYPHRSCPHAGAIFPEEISSGYMLASAFGRFSAAALEAISEEAEAQNSAIWVTPFRSFWLAQRPGSERVRSAVITDPTDPLLRIQVCTGAPGCHQARQPTRDLARALAPSLGACQKMHISGCAKGCAHPKPCAITLVAQSSGFDLVRHGAPWDDPCQTGLSQTDIEKALTS